MADQAPTVERVTELRKIVEAREAAWMHPKNGPGRKPEAVRHQIYLNLCEAEEAHRQCLAAYVESFKE